MTYLCYYHREDLDGAMSAAIVRKYAKGGDNVFIPIPVTHGDDIDWTAYKNFVDPCVVIVDFAPEGDTKGILEKLNYNASLLWLDHHKTAIDAANSHKICGIRDTKFAACELTYKYFYGDGVMPKSIELLGRYDVFDRSDHRKWEKQILPFQYGMRLHAPVTEDPHRLMKILEETLLWDDRDVDDMIGIGETVLKYQKTVDEKTCRGAYEIEFEGHDCIAVNASGSSTVLDSAAKPHHKIRIMWRFVGDKFVVSLYENGHDDIDCGALAKKFGGGGHKGAAGFSVEDIRPIIP